MSSDVAKSAPGDGDGADDDLVRAAGCLVWRPRADPSTGGDGHGVGVEVLVVHRPLYDDWDFPKGKLEKGESELECALRETEEETGFTGVIGDELPSDRYLVPRRGSADGEVRPKSVRWWLLRQTGGVFVPNDEVDEVRWLDPDDAAELLTYAHARSLIALVPAAE